MSWNTTDNTLRDFFATSGTVTSATVLTDKFTGKSRGFGFVEMPNDEEAKAAIQKLNGQMLDGRTIVVNEARPMAPRDNNFKPRSFDNRGGGGSDRGGPRRDFRSSGPRRDSRGSR